MSAAASIGVAAPSAERLRALDWRFLLPAPAGGAFEHLVLLGGTPVAVRDAIDSGVALHATCEAPRTERADVVVCLRSAVGRLDDALRSLRPGGMLYVETGRDVNRAFRPAAVRRMLRQSGLSETGLYWCRPDDAHRDAYVPLDHAGALRWYLATVHGTSSSRAALGRAALHVLARSPETLSTLVASCAVTAVAGPGGFATPPSILGVGLRRDEGSARARPVVLTPRTRRVVMFPFAPGAERPLAALKVSRTPSRNEVTANEQRVLARLHERLDALTAESIPRPLGSADWGGLTVGAETVVAGRSLFAAVRASRTPTSDHVRAFRGVAEWLTDFHCRTVTSRPRWGSRADASSMQGVVANYERCCVATGAERVLFAEILRRSNELSDVPFPIVWAHADFTSRNVAWSGSSVAVFDWAGGREGLPLVDLLTFAASWMRDVRSDRDELAPFTALLLGPDDQLTLAVRAAVAEYVAALSIDARFVPVLMVRLWCELAAYTSSKEREARTAVEPAAPRNVYARYVRTIADNGDRFLRRWAPDAVAAAERSTARERVGV